MNLADSVTHHFQNGHVGQGFLDGLALPLDTFPCDGTWNQFTSLTEEEKAALRRHTVGSPPIEANKASPLNPGPSATQLAAFSKLNAGAVRFSPRHLLWTAEDIRALHQRQSFSSSLMMVKVYREDSTFSAPFLCITGPMSVPLQGEAFNTRAVFHLGDDDPLPLIHGTSRLPERIAPSSISLSVASREWIEDTAPSQLLLETRNKGRILTLFDSTPLHTTVPVLDSSDHLWERLQSEKHFIEAGLWSPASLAPTGSLLIDKPTAKAWLRTSLVPPNPRTSAVWDSGGTAASRVPAEEYKPTLSASLALMQAEDSPIGQSPGFLLVPRFLRFPVSALLPVGLVLDPRHTTVTGFRAVVNTLSAPQTDGSTKWLDNALLDAWLQAASNDPDAFAVPMFPHSHFMAAFPAHISPAASIRLHQEWSLLSHFIWDHALATAPGARGGNLAIRIKKYAIALIAANNQATGGTAMSRTWGFFGSIYGQPVSGPVTSSF
jgi:hypothetical protein